MKLPILSLVALAALSAPAADEVGYRPDEGLSLKREFEAAAEFTRDDVSMTVDGETPPDSPDEFPSLEIVSTRRLVVTDTLETMGDGRPTRLRRAFDELSSDVTFTSGDDERAQNTISDLEGKAVVFAWDDEAEEFSVEPDEDEEIDDELLEWLQEDMDLRAFLPDGEVDVGDEWDLPGEAYLGIGAPGGLIAFHAEDEEVNPTEYELAVALMLAVSGEGTATYLGTRDEGDRRVAVIGVEMEVSAAAEVDTETATEEISQVLADAMERELKGEILWDLEHGHLHSLAIEAEAVRTQTLTTTYATPDGDVEAVNATEFSGSIRYTMSISRD